MMANARLQTNGTSAICCGPIIHQHSFNCRLSRNTSSQQIRRQPIFAFDDDNCITEASSRSIIAASLGSGGGGGSGTGGGGGEIVFGSGGGLPDDGSSKPHPMQVPSLVFAVFMALGGVMAYVKKGSTKSLGAGLSTSLLMALCARSMVGLTAAGPVRVAFAVSLVLGVAMANRYNDSKKFMPAGLVALSSLAMAAGYAGFGL